MESTQSFIAEHIFPGPPPALQSELSHRATPLFFPTPQEGVYRITLQSKLQWKFLWQQALARRAIRLNATLPRHRPLTLLLILQSPDAAFRLPLMATVESDDDPQIHLAFIEPPTLSWRLAAIRMGKILPTYSDESDSPADLSRAQLLRRNTLPAGFFARRFRLRPDLPTAASAIAITPDLTPVVIALRAGFLHLDELLQQTSISPERARQFLGALHSADLLVDAPTPLMSTNDPFDYFAIHWSAHDEIIRRRYAELKILANSHPQKEAHLKRLGIAFDLLLRPERRRALRRARVHPPILSEVIDHFRRLATQAHDASRIDDAIDHCRRVLELASFDSEFAALLIHLQHMRSTERRASTL